MPSDNGNIPGLLRAIQTRLEVKILLLIIAVLLAGFGTYVIITIQKESEVLLQQHHEKLELFSETIAAGVRNVMLTGKAPLTHEFVNDARQNLRFADLTIYDRFGREVFLREGEGIVYGVPDSVLRQTLRIGDSRWAMVRDHKDVIYARYEVLKNTQECWRCHDPKQPIRGILNVALRPETIRTTEADKALQQMASLMGETIAIAFRTIMLGGQGEMMDTLTAQARSMPAIEQVQVYSRLGYLAFGPEEPELSEEKILEILQTHNRDRAYHYERMGNLMRLYVPLSNQDRCQVCHGSNFPMRGVIVIDFRIPELRSYLQDPDRLFTWALQATVFEGFKSIMLVGRATSARYFMDELRSLPIFHTLRVFDSDANERFLNPPPRKRPEIQTVVNDKKTLEFVESVNGEEMMVRLSPLPNEVRCYSCHGKNHEIRGVVEVAASMNMINETIATNKRRSLLIGLITLFLVWGVIRLFMQSVVVKPVQIIERVATRVGEGDFSVQATVASRDEIGNLARRINEMIQGLRERFQLQKFVSQQTVEAIKKSDFQGVKLGGERKVATVFFSDIRGFTAYSERVEPERVVTMLNHCLSRQSSIVRKNGGDIDKYVGDELVAVFEGEGMVEKAVRAALEVQEDIQRNRTEDLIGLGIGINTGEMVMGAMGSDERMDYTVIGDNVNLGARLCSLAREGQILLSESSASFVRDHPEFELHPLEPLMVKGKQDPVKVYDVRRRTSSAEQRDPAVSSTHTR
ncbi:MAG TPA: adenylate/guanylate cyclase domain-containing protein [Bacteroidota bacterium]|nr:adenylate/guanylate cyclase domain-containing protein [Bacteroidota bacterium]